MDQSFKKRLPSLAVTSLMAGAAGMGILASEPALAAFDMFLDIPGIPGESRDAKHKNQIDVLSYSHTFAPGDKVKGARTNCSLVQIGKFVDRASPALALRAVTGQSIPTMTLTVQQAGEKALEFYTVTMQDVTVVSSQVNGAGGDDRMEENVSLNMGSATIEYRSQDGSAGAPVTESVTCNPAGR